MPIKVRSLRQVPMALKRAFKRSGVEHVMLAQAKRRIDAGGDSTLKYAPLKDLSGAARAFFEAENRRRVAAGSKPWRPPAVFGSFRAGGQPLKDTGQHIYNPLHARRTSTRSSVTFAVQSGGPDPLVAVYHQYGFKTKGPNYVALTVKARRDHRKGADPRSEGQIPGIDYLMFWRGVRCPPRPIVNFPPEDVREITDAFAAALR